MLDRFSRTRLLIGKNGMERLSAARVAVFGVGGVGGYAVEALVRSGVGTVDIFDNDTVSLTNLNRQIIATEETVGRYKVDVMRERALSINPDVVINAHNCFYMPDNADEYDLSEYTYIIDAVDTVTAKIELIVRAEKAGVPIISSMGAGNKLDPSRFEVSDIYKTSVCPLARTMRRELKRRGIRKLKVVYSKEEPIRPAETDTDGESGARKSIPGSVAFVPAAAGLIAAGEVIRDIADC
ncbi:MAG: tRNA threonylcarbamoyladenosine dehydratase [Firmicutes bacterium]|nr:tRNA threonylcarbamoyladenosine dehydratase [Bacillota bacterium]